jgi:hypothetical protein
MLDSDQIHRNPIKSGRNNRFSLKKIHERKINVGNIIFHMKLIQN